VIKSKSTSFNWNY